MYVIKFLRPQQHILAMMYSRDKTRDLENCVIHEGTENCSCILVTVTPDYKIPIRDSILLLLQLDRLLLVHQPFRHRAILP